MRIVRTESMKLADKVLTLLRKKPSKELPGNFYVEAYANGREHGYSVVYMPEERVIGGALAAVFAQDRRSDYVVAYFGFSHEFCMQGNTPSEAIYAGKEMFATPAEAADGIIKGFQEMIRKAKKLAEIEKKNG